MKLLFLLLSCLSCFGQFAVLLLACSLDLMAQPTLKNSFTTNRPGARVVGVLDFIGPLAVSNLTILSTTRSFTFDAGLTNDVIQLWQLRSATNGITAGGGTGIATNSGTGTGNVFTASTIVTAKSIGVTNLSPLLATANRPGYIGADGLLTNAASFYQPSNTSLTAIGALANSVGTPTNNGAGVWGMFDLATLTPAVTQTTNTIRLIVTNETIFGGALRYNSAIVASTNVNISQTNTWTETVTQATNNFITIADTEEGILEVTQDSTGGWALTFSVGAGLTLVPNSSNQVTSLSISTNAGLRTDVRFKRRGTQVQYSVEPPPTMFESDWSAVNGLVPGANMIFSTNAGVITVTSSAGASGLNGNLTNVTLWSITTNRGGLMQIGNALATTAIGGTNTDYFTNLSANLTFTYASLISGLMYHVGVSNVGTFTGAFPAGTFNYIRPGEALSFPTNAQFDVYVWLDITTSRTNAMIVGPDASVRNLSAQNFTFSGQITFAEQYLTAATPTQTINFATAPMAVFTNACTTNLDLTFSGFPAIGLTADFGVAFIGGASSNFTLTVHYPTGFTAWSQTPTNGGYYTNITATRRGTLALGPHATNRVDTAYTESLY